jgi:dTDP-4-dehydrorhamnose 3,5-epimerase-like enzyme
MTTINDILIINLQTFTEVKGNLSPLESAGLLDIKRFFYVYGVPPGEIRGRHSHIETRQLFICSTGSVKITCDDGKNKVTYQLNTPSTALLVPAGIWAEELYEEEGTVLMVLCNTHYDPKDYVTNYEEFKKVKLK